MKFPLSLPALGPPSPERLSPLRRVRLWAAQAAAAGIVAGALASLFLAGRRLDSFLRASSFFQLRELRIEGATPELEREIRDAIRTETGGESPNLFELRESHVRFWLETLPRVAKVEVRKVYPAALEIAVSERRPVAPVHLGRLYWVDREGVLLGPASPREVADSGAPVVTGLEDLKFTPGMHLNHPRLREVLDAVRHLGEKDGAMARLFSEWNIAPSGEVTGILNRGVEVRFGPSDPLDRIPALAAFLESKKDWDRCAYIDLRFEAQAVYR